MPVRWTVDVEVDERWYALHGLLADKPCPPSSCRTVELVDEHALIGRTSEARQQFPAVALDEDTGVSRRHAQLVRDGDRLTVVDLSSTNGTYVVQMGDDPHEGTGSLLAGVPHELHDGDRVFCGAWSRLTFRSVRAG